jgi:hypothetical protein
MPLEIGGIIIGLLILYISVYSSKTSASIRELNTLKLELNKRVDRLYIKYDGNLTLLLESEKDMLTKYEYCQLINKTLSVFEDEVKVTQ